LTAAPRAPTGSVVKCRRGEQRLRYEGGFYEAAPSGQKTKVPCWNKNFPNQGPPQIRSAPHKCHLFRRGIDFLAGAVLFRTHRWKHWGANETRARGKYYEPMNVEDPWHPLRVKLVKPIERCGRTVYSKAIFKSHGHTTEWPLWTTCRHTLGITSG
jgi:hypothetical protein